MTEPIATWDGLPAELRRNGGAVYPPPGRPYLCRGDVSIRRGEVQVEVHFDGFPLAYPDDAQGFQRRWQVRQRGGALDANHCLFPPWLNTAIIIRDGDMRAVVRMPMWFRPRLKRALRQAGIELRWHRQLFLTLNADPLPPRRPPKAG